MYEPTESEFEVNMEILSLPDSLAVIDFGGVVSSEKRDFAPVHGFDSYRRNTDFEGGIFGRVCITGLAVKELSVEMKDSPDTDS